MKQILFYSILLMLALVSCTKHLSRDDARDQIVTEKKYPITQTFKFTKKFTKDWNTQGNGVTVDIGGNQFDKEKKAIEAFKELGLVELKEEPHREETSQFLLGTTIRTWTSVEVHILESAKKYLAKEDEKSYIVNLWETSVDNITGIKEMPEQKMAIVEYVTSNTSITPFGNYFMDKSEKSNKSVIFSLFDDGWRINKY